MSNSNGGPEDFGWIAVYGCKPNEFELGTYPRRTHGHKSTLAVLADSAGAEPSQRFKVVLNRRSIADLVYIVHISPHVAGFKRETSWDQPLLRQLFSLLPPWARIALAHKISLHIAGAVTCPKFHTSSIAFMSGCYCNTSQVNKDTNKAAIAVARRRPHALRHLLSRTSQPRYSNVVMSTSIDT